MNFLGHLYFSQNNPELMYANIFGDFVKGKDLSHFKPIVQQGITLHRSIDAYIDHHPTTKKILSELYADLPKIAGIAIDLYYDHLLSKNWIDFSDVPLEDFLTRFENHAISEADYPSESFHYVLLRMKKGRWLINYAELDGLDKACRGVSQRISFPNTLFTGKEVFLKYENQITEVFYEYMNAARTKF